jgi:SAM-dependent methyltransferase
MPTLIDPFVQEYVASTCGNLYKPLIGKLDRYPIPRFPLQGGGDLLDIGCGWGRWTIAAAVAGFNATGVDAWPEAIAAAQRVSVQLESPALFAVGKADQLEFADRSFDVVFSFSVFQHLLPSAIASAFGEVRRVLRPGGLAYIEMPSSAGLWNRLRATASRQAKDMHYFSRCELFQLGGIVGDVQLRPDAYFSLNAQMTDLTMLPLRAWPVVLGSEGLVRLARILPVLGKLADSLFVVARRAAA